jgi:hypothetical protein
VWFRSVLYIYIYIYIYIILFSIIILFYFILKFHLCEFFKTTWTHKCAISFLAMGKIQKDWGSISPLNLVCNFESVVYGILGYKCHQLKIVASPHIIQKSRHVSQFTYTWMQNELPIFYKGEIHVALLLYISIFYINILCYPIIFLGAKILAQNNARCQLHLGKNHIDCQ